MDGKIDSGVGTSLSEAIRQDLALGEEGLELDGVTDLSAIVAAITRSAIGDDVLAEALRRRIDEMRERLARIEGSRDRKRELALLGLREIGVKKLIEPDFTVWLRQGAPAVEIVDETVIPLAYWVAQEPKLNRGALYQALKAGGVIPGAVMMPGEPSLAIRRS